MATMFSSKCILGFVVLTLTSGFAAKWKIALKIGRLKELDFKPRHSSIDAVRLTVRELAKEVLT